MYDEFTPLLIYGVKESDSNRVISREFLEQHNMEAYPDAVVRNRACTFIYGKENEETESDNEE